MFFERDTYSYKGYVKEKHFICKKIQLLCQWGIFQWLSHLTPKLLEKGFTNCKNKCLPVTIHEKFGKPKYTFTVKWNCLCPTSDTNPNSGPMEKSLISNTSLSLLVSCCSLMKIHLLNQDINYLSTTITSKIEFFQKKYLNK